MEDIYNKISEIMVWYGEFSRIAFPDELLDKRDELAVLSFHLAEKTGNSGIEKDNSYFIRVINIAKYQDSLLEKDVPFNKSETKSLLQNESYYRDAMQKKSISNKNDILLKQVNIVLFAMDKRIDYAMKEKYNAEKLQK